MGYVFRLNLAKSKVDDGAVSPYPLSACPALHSMFASRMSAVVPASDVPWSLAAQGCTYVRLEKSDPTPASLEDVGVFQTISGENASHKKRQRDGEVLVSERQVGTAKFSARGSFVTNKSVHMESRGWFFAKDLPGGRVAYPMATSGYAYSFNLVYDWLPIAGITAPPLLVAESLVPFKDGFVIPDERFDLAPDEGLVTQALADANSKQWDLLTEFAELPETLLFIREALEKLAKETDEYQIRRRGFAAAFADDVATLASLWLAYRYAVMPIILSIQDAVRVFEDVPRRYAEYKAVSTREIAAPFMTGFTGTSTMKCVGRVFIKRKYDAMGFIEELLDRVQFNIVASAWEYTRLSFVIDWALNISDLILALTGDDSCMQEAATWSSRAEGSWDYTSMTDGSSCSVLLDFYHRKPIQPIAHVGLSVGNHMTWRRVIDSVALLYQPLRKKLRSLK